MYITEHFSLSHNSYIHIIGSLTKNVICSATFSFPSKMIIFPESKFIKHHEKTIKMLSVL